MNRDSRIIGDAAPPDRRTFIALILTMIVVTLPHAMHLDTFLILFFLGAAAWRLLAIPYPRLRPNRWLLAVLMLAALALVVTRVPLQDGSLAGTALLVVMLGLKMLESRNRRDVRLSIFLGFFVILTQFLYQQALWLAVFLFLSSGLLLALLVDSNRGHSSLRAALRSAGMQLMAASPLALVLFLFFPRLDAPLWSVNIRNDSAVTGISDHLRPGGIGKLSRSGEVAFRARFSGPVPPQQELYWRGPVLWHYDGQTWSPGAAHAADDDIQIEPGSRVDYELTMEASGQYWVFALDIPTASPDSLALGPERQLLARSRLDERTLYRLGSNLHYRLGSRTPPPPRLGLQLPSGVGDRTRSLARQWRRQHPDDDRAVIGEALRYFREQPFVYTLTPGIAAGDPVEDFLFERRRGFCEHYASSFTLLMRLAGIPARVIVGYQGGVRNPVGDHLIVRQSDAHAWSEVWLRGEGWVRIDPTAAVAPERIEYPIDAELSARSDRIVFGNGDSGWIRGLLRNVQWAADTLEFGWYRWVLSFTPNRQRDLLASLGLDRLGRYAPALMLGIGLSAFMALLILSPRGMRHRGDRLARDWRRFRDKLRRAGLGVPEWQGPEQLGKRAARRWPALGPEFDRITRLYVRLRYGPPPTSVEHRTLRRQLHRRIRALRIR